MNGEWIPASGRQSDRLVNSVVTALFTQAAGPMVTGHFIQNGKNVHWP